MNDQIELPEEGIVEEIQEIAEGDRYGLDKTTLEPAAEVERSGDYDESEAIEVALVEAVEESTPSDRAGEEEEPAVLEAELVAEVQPGSDRVEVRGEGSIKSVQVEGGEEIPVVELVPEVEALTAIDEGESEGERMDRREGEGGSEQENVEASAMEDRVAVPESVSAEVAEAISEGEPEAVEVSVDETESAPTDELEAESEPDAGPAEVWDQDAEQIQEVKEYWEPPEMYIYESPDGSIKFVNANGNPIDSPPNLVSQPEGSSNNPYQAWYPGSDSSETFEVPKYTPTTEGVYAYYGQDGSVTLVAADGGLIESPPKYIIDGDSKPIVKGPDGTAIFIPEYKPSLFGVYAHISNDGSVSMVDKNGQLLDCPPHYDVDIGQGKVYTKGPDGEAIEILKYVPPLAGIYAYTGQDGTVMIVDKDGKLIDCPPSFDVDELGGEVLTKGPDGSAIEIPEYKPYLDNVFSYISQDGSVIIVDVMGKLIDCPPHYDFDPQTGETYTKLSDGSAHKIASFKPQLEGVFVYTAQDGSKSIVDSNGNMVDCPPHIKKVVDAKGDVHYYADYLGSKTVELKNYKPVSSHWGKP